MGFFNSLKGQVGRDTGRRISNAIFGNKHATKYQRVDADNSANERRNLKIQKDYELEVLEQEYENQENIYELKQLKKSNSRFQKEIANIISIKVPQRKDDLIDALNELATMIASNPWKDIFNQDNKISNNYSDVVLKKYEQCLFVLKSKFPKESEIPFFESQYKKFKRIAFFQKGKSILILLLLGIIMGIGIYNERDKPKETPIKDFFKSFTKPE